MAINKNAAKMPKNNYKWKLKINFPNTQILYMYNRLNDKSISNFTLRYRYRTFEYHMSD